MSKVLLCAIGDEVLDGRTINTNASSLAQHLTLSGLQVVRHAVIGDNLEELSRFFQHETLDVDIVISCGGLGPTVDDKTRTMLQNTFGWSFTTDNDWYVHLQKTWHRVDTKLESQALVPQGAYVLANEHGTACGFVMQHNRRFYAFLPGVPQECLGMFTELMDYLYSQDYLVFEKMPPPVPVYFVGVYERVIDDIIRRFQEQTGSALEYGFYPNLCEVTLTIRGDQAEQRELLVYLEQHYSQHILKDTLLRSLANALADKRYVLKLPSTGTMFYLRWLLSSVLEFPENSHEDSNVLEVAFFCDEEQQQQCTLELIKDGKTVFQNERHIVSSCPSHKDKMACSWILGQILLFLRAST